MSDARTVIANIKQRVYALHGGTVEAKLGSALAADILAALAEAGLVIVPREPTPNRIVKMLDALPSDWSGFMSEDIKELWCAMVEAANE